MGAPASTSFPTVVVEEIRYIVKRQELELEALHKKLDQVVRYFFYNTIYTGEKIYHTISLFSKHEPEIYNL